jgi:protein-L-isoaspartate(D-aspartate) O-methyltransferase
MSFFAQARQKMVAEQLVRRGIQDAGVLAAMAQVPREMFVPDELVDRAYDDGPLPIGAGQTISQPYMVALMCEVARIGPSERVLEVGTGSGYHAAVLSRLAAAVFSLERLPELVEQARQRLAACAANVALRLGEGGEGWPEQAPFDVIMVTAAMPGLPRPLLSQLAPLGRLVAPVGEKELQSLVRVTRRGGHWHEEYFGECRFVQMIGAFGFTE